MKVGAVICEFNPLHNGHLYLINKAREQCDILVAIMSGDFNQRGIPSIVSKEIKSKWAIKAGFDIVVENNFEYVIQSSDNFALGAIMQAKSIGVTDLFFGSENFQSEDFENIVEVIKNNQQYIKENINGKTNYPRVISKLLLENNISLNSPNDILGVSYLSAIQTLKCNIKINPIKRLGGFHSLIPYNDKICSATFIRENMNNIEKIEKYVPKYVYDDLNKYKHIEYYDFEPIIINKLYNSTNYELKSVFGVDEGLENRIKRLLKESKNLKDLIGLVKTKRYTYNRLQRMFLLIGLDIKKESINNNIILDTINLLYTNNKLDISNLVIKNSIFENKIKRIYNKVANSKGDINMSFIVEAQIEIQKNSKNKYETLDNGKLKLDRVLPSSQVYPTDYGFFNQTLGQDGDPLDVLVLSSESLLPTSLVDVRIVGVMFMVDSGEKDEKLLGVVEEDPRFDHIQSLVDVPEHTLKELTNYFTTYKLLQNKTTEVLGFEDVSTAKSLYDDAVERYNNENK